MAGHIGIIGMSLGMLGLIIVSGCMAPAEIPLNGTTWKLISYDNGSSLVEVLNGTTVTAEFVQEQMAGTAGCNHYFGTYRATISSLRIEGIGMTEMYCTAPPGVMDQEGAYLALLGVVRQYSIDRDTLTLSDESGRTLLVFERVVPLPPRPLVDTNWTLDSFISGDAVSSVLAGSRVTAVFSADGRLGGTAGCNQYFASYALAGTSLSISGVGSTKMYCSAPEGVMEQESMYLNMLTSAKSYTIDEDRLTLSGPDGKGILAYRASD